MIRLMAYFTLRQLNIKPVFKIFLMNQLTAVTAVEHSLNYGVKLQQ